MNKLHTRWVHTWNGHGMSATLDLYYSLIVWLAIGGLALVIHYKDWYIAL